MLTRYFIKLTFRGTNYHGWQVQKDAVTVQSLVNDSLSLILKENISVTGAGRTDSGVHAINYVAHFDSLKPDLDTEKNLLFKLNGFLPQDILVQEIYKVRNNDHARYSAISRTYHYILSRRKNPFLREFCYFIHRDIDIRLMNKACQLMKEQDDFTSFSKLKSNNKTNTCHIYSAEWKEVENGIFVFRITADRFLRGMVRAITGTMLDIGSLKISAPVIIEILERKDRCEAGMAVPPEGLFFTGVKYGNDVIPEQAEKDANALIPLNYLFF